MTMLLLTAYHAVLGQSGPVNGNSELTASVNGPVVKWDKTTEEMGNIPLGTPKTAEFILKNDGNEPLLISSAKASCGCTNLKYDREPLLPGKTTTVSVTYNAASKGTFIKTVTVTTNAGDKPVVLQIKGNVVLAGEVKS
jgi:hypothetical protein